MRPTPRTDAHASQCVGDGFRECFCASADFARTLERELAEAVEVITKLSLELGAAYHGLRNLPEDHSAVEAETEARAFLNKVK